MNNTRAESSSIIPYVVIGTREMRCLGIGRRDIYIVAHVYGVPSPNDRIYLRHVSKSGIKSTKSYKFQTYRHRLAHPVNPAGADGGDLPAHLQKSGLTGGAPKDHTWHNIRTEWEIKEPNETIVLFDVNVFNPVFDRHKANKHRYRVILDFVVARVNKKARTLMYGAASQMIYVWRYKDSQTSIDNRYAVKFQ